MLPGRHALSESLSHKHGSLLLHKRRLAVLTDADRSVAAASRRSVAAGCLRIGDREWLLLRLYEASVHKSSTDRRGREGIAGGARNMPDVVLLKPDESPSMSMEPR